MRYTISLSFYVAFLWSTPLLAGPLQIVEYEPSPTDFSQFGDAAVLQYFSFGQSLAQTELFVGPGSPPPNEQYSVSTGNVGTGTKVILVSNQGVAVDPVLAELTFDAQWDIPVPPDDMNGMPQWGNNFMDRIDIRDASGLFFASLSAVFDFGCDPSNLPCGGQVSIIGSDVLNFVDVANEEIEIVIDYYDGDTINDLGDCAQECPNGMTGPPAFTVSNFNLFVPEPCSFQLIVALWVVVTIPGRRS